jgi:hypothetical protein
LEDWEEGNGAESYQRYKRFLQWEFNICVVKSFSHSVIVHLSIVFQTLSDEVLSAFLMFWIADLTHLIVALYHTWVKMLVWILWKESLM